LKHTAASAMPNNGAVSPVAFLRWFLQLGNLFANPFLVPFQLPVPLTQFTQFLLVSKNLLLLIEKWRSPNRLDVAN
jgi:hypothetical protein